MLKKKILIVDDEPNIVKMLESRLKANDFDVITASDGMEALKRARTEKPDLIILDVMLPEMDGYKVCAMLKFDIRHSRIPIIMLTARAHEEDKKMGEELGVDDYIIKPFDGRELLDKIGKLLRN